MRATRVGLRLLVCTIALVPVSALPSVHSSALVCRSPIPDALDGDECPAVLRCNSAHGCAWMAIQHVLPSVASISVVEVARHAPWGFFEFGSQRHNVALADFDDASARQLLRRVGRSTTTVAAVFHILVGEGVSRRKWRAAVASAMRAGAVEVWVMEHDRLAKSWLNRSAWPIGHDSNPPREDGSEFFTLTELRAEVQSLARLHCGSRTSMLASCQVPSSRRDRRRNLLVGVQCNCASRAHVDTPHNDLGGTSQRDEGLFCSMLSDRPYNNRSRILYGGFQYVYTFHADSPNHLLKLSPALSIMYGQAIKHSPRLQAPKSRVSFASVVGSMSMLNLLLDMPPLDDIVLFDINLWMLEYGAMLVEVILSSTSRLDFVAKMLSRDVQHLVKSFGENNLTRQMEDAIMKLPVQQGAARSVQGSLSKHSACAHRWLTHEMHVGNRIQAKRRQVCERIALFHNADRPPKLNPELVHSCNEHPTARKCKYGINTCSLYYGRGWLASEESFLWVSRRLRTLQIHCARVPEARSLRWPPSWLTFYPACSCGRRSLEYQPACSQAVARR